MYGYRKIAFIIGRKWPGEVVRLQINKSCVLTPLTLSCVLGQDILTLHSIV